MTFDEQFIVPPFNWQMDLQNKGPAQASWISRSFKKSDDSDGSIRDLTRAPKIRRHDIVIAEATLRGAVAERNASQ